MTYIGEGYAQSGLVAGYHLSDTTDFSGNGYNLTNNNTVTFPAGKFNKCADFGTANTNKSLSIASNIGYNDTAWTITSWIKVNTEIGSGFYYFLNIADTTRKVRLDWSYQYNSGTRRLGCGRTRVGVAQDFVFHNVTLGTSNWYYLAMTYNGSTVTLYLNGNSVGTVASSGDGSGAITTATYLGSTSTPDFYASMSMDEFQFYNVAKDARWVRQQYALGVGKFY